MERTVLLKFDLGNLGEVGTATARVANLETSAAAARLKVLALSVAAAGVAAFGGVVRQSIAAASEAQAIQAQLAAAIKSTGGAAGVSLEQLNKWAKGLQSTTAYSDEAVGSSQALLLTFTKIRGDTFNEATKAVVDLATALGGDLQGATIQVAKALQGNAGSLTALVKSGVAFDEQQKKQIKNFFDTGQAAKAQAIILKELAVEFGGSAAAYRNTLGGALASMHNQLGEVFETIGQNIAPVLVELAEKFRAAAEAGDFDNVARTIGGALISAIRGLAEVAQIAGKALLFLAENVDKVRAALVLLLAIQAAGWITSLGRAVVALTGTLLGATSAINSLAFVTPLAAKGLNALGLTAGAATAALAGIALILGSVAFAMKNYIDKTNEAYAVQQKELSNQADVYNYLDGLKGRKEKLTQLEYGLAKAIRARLAVEAIAALTDAENAKRSLERAQARLRTALASPIQAGLLGAGLPNSILNNAAEAEKLTAAYQDAKGKADALQRQQVLLATAITDVGVEAAESAGSVAGLSDKQEKAAAAARQMVAELREAAEWAQTFADAAGSGEQAERAANRIKAISDEVAKVRATLAGAGLSLPPAMEASVRAAAAALYDYNAIAETARTGQDAFRDVLLDSETAIASLSVSFKDRLGESVDDVSGRIDEAAKIVQALQFAVATGAKGSEDYARAERNLAEAQKVLVDALGRRIAIEAQINRGGRAEIASQTAALGTQIAKIKEQTEVLGLSRLEAQRWATHQAIMAEAARVASETIKHVAGESAGEYARRWLAAAAEVRAALEDQADKETAKKIKDYIEAPLKQAAATTRDSFNDAFAELVTGGEVSVKSLIATWAKLWAKAFAEWLQRWIANQAKAAAASRAAKIAGGDSGGTGGVSLGSLGGAGGTGGTTGAGAGAGAAALGTVAVFAAIYFGVKSWINSHRKEWGELTIGAGGTGVTNTAGTKKSLAALTQMLEGFINGIRDFSRAMDGQFVKLEQSITVGSKGQGKKKEYYVKLADQVVATFGNDAQAAMEAAFVLAVQHSEIRGLSPLVKEAIEKSMATTVEAFQESLAAFAEIADINLPDAAIAVRSATAHLNELWEELVKLGSASPAAVQGFQDLGAAIVDSWQSWADSITGRQRTAAEELALKQQEGKLFNARIALYRVELQMRLAELQASATTTRTRGTIIRAGLDLEGLELGARGAYLQARLGQFQAEAALMTGYTDLVQAQINAITAILASLPTDIDIGGIQVGGGRRGGGGPKEQTVDQWLAERRKGLLPDLLRQLKDLDDAYAEELKKKGLTAEEIKKLNELREEERKRIIATAKASLRRDTRDFMKPRNEIEQAMLGIQDAAIDLKKRWKEMYEAGEITAAQLARLLADLANATAARRNEVLVSAGQSLILELYDVLGKDHEAALMRWNLTLLDYKLRLATLREQLALYGLLNAANQAMIDAAGGLLDEFERRGPPTTAGPPPPDRNEQQLYAERLAEEQANAARAQEQAAERMRRAAEALLDLNRTLSDPRYNPATAREQFDQQYAELMRTIALAQSGDVDAMERLRDLEGPFLELARQLGGTTNLVGGTGQTYQQLYAYLRELNAQLAAGQGLGGGTGGGPPVPGGPPAGGGGAGTGGSSGGGVTYSTFQQTQAIVQSLADVRRAVEGTGAATVQAIDRVGQKIDSLRGSGFR